MVAATHAITLRRKRGRWFHIRPIYLGVRLFFSFFTSLASFLAFFDLLSFLAIASSRAARHTTVNAM